MKVARRPRLEAILLALCLLSVSAIKADGSTTTSSLTTAEYDSVMEHTATPSPGCYDSTYPNTTWTEVACGASHPGPATVGYTSGDYNQQAGTGTIIGFAQGQFSSATDIESVYDSDENADNYYSLQLNTQQFSCGLGDGYECWEQFVFENVPISGGDYSTVFMQYWLIGYLGENENCPSGGWYAPQGSTSCYLDSDVNNVPDESPLTELPDLSLSGQANYEDSGEDEAALCAGLNCYATSASDSVIDLYQYWNVSEFNIFGTYNGGYLDIGNSEASLTVNLQEQEENSAIIDGTCANHSFTQETNNMTLGGSCTVTGTYDIMSFSESG